MGNAIYFSDWNSWRIKFMFNKKTTKIKKSPPSIWHLLVRSKRQLDGKDLLIFCGLLKKQELYQYDIFHLVTPQFWSYKTAGNFLPITWGWKLRVYGIWFLAESIRITYLSWHYSARTYTVYSFILFFPHSLIVSTMCNETAMCYYEMVADILASRYFANSSWILKIETNWVWKKGLEPTLRNLFKNLISWSEIFFKFAGIWKIQAGICFKFKNNLTLFSTSL